MNKKPRASQASNTRTDLDDQFHEGLARLTMGLSPISMGLAYADWALHLAVSPQTQHQLGQLALSLTQKTLLQQFNASQPGSEGSNDARFKDPAWTTWPYKFYKDWAQANEAWWHESTKVQGVSDHHQHMVRFFARQWLDALSPSNWASTNPEVVQQLLKTKGESWRKGMQYFLEDSQKIQRQTLGANPAKDALPPLPFQVGKDVAITPGKVVYKNQLIELIQYAPSTATVHREPLLIVPSCIMKYYILDLSEHNSMVKYLVDQGFTVFMVSWRNPDEKDRHLGMDDYIQHGVLDAIEATQRLSKSKEIHAMGYCLGGTFLAIAAALLGNQSDSTPLASVTLLAAQTDFSEPGELGVFIDDDQLRTLREEMAHTGYLSGKMMAASFQFLGSRDLIWSRNTHRYLLGQDEVGNDMMSWNMDTTRLPERMHNEYLNSLFLHNALSEGYYHVEGQAIALMDIHVPMMIVGTERDHISPWKSVYKIHLNTDVDTTFILASGGHNAGIVSEPGHPNRSYQMNHQAAGHGWIEPQVWQAQAPHHEGSWWSAWRDWLVSQSSGSVKARKIAPQTALYDAPGRYVLQRYAD